MPTACGIATPALLRPVSKAGVDWTLSTASNVNYRSVPPGSYRFEVEAFTPDGTVYTQRASVAFFHPPSPVDAAAGLACKPAGCGRQCFSAVPLSYPPGTAAGKTKTRISKERLTSWKQQALQAMMSPQLRVQHPQQHPLPDYA